MGPNRCQHYKSMGNIFVTNKTIMPRCLAYEHCIFLNLFLNIKYVQGEGSEEREEEVDENNAAIVIDEEEHENTDAIVIDEIENENTDAIDIDEQQEEYDDDDASVIDEPEEDYDGEYEYDHENGEVNHNNNDDSTNDGNNDKTNKDAINKGAEVDIAVDESQNDDYNQVNYKSLS